jgi:hypothetical protein
MFCDIETLEVDFLGSFNPRYPKFSLVRSTALDAPRSDGSDLPFAYRGFTFREVEKLLSLNLPIFDIPISSLWQINDR